MTVAWLIVLAVLLSVIPVGQLATRPAVRQLVLRPIRRRPGRAGLLICGVLLATAAVTTRGLVGDGLTASIAHGIPSQLGPVDEEVLVPGADTNPPVEAAITAAQIRNLQTLPLVAQPAVVIGKDFVARLSSAQMIEVDFARAAQFGPDPTATGISGATPTGATVVLGADLAAVLLIKPGHRVEIHAYGQSRVFHVAQILPRRGLAGLANVGEQDGSESLNVFVPLGTIESMRQAAGAASTPSTATSVVAVANGGPSPGVTARLVGIAAGLGAWVRPVKRRID